MRIWIKNMRKIFTSIKYTSYQSKVYSFLTTTNYQDTGGARVLASKNWVTISGEDTANISVKIWSFYPKFTSPLHHFESRDWFRLVCTLFRICSIYTNFERFILNFVSIELHAEMAFFAHKLKFEEFFLLEMSVCGVDRWRMWKILPIFMYFQGFFSLYASALVLNIQLTSREKLIFTTSARIG